ncbi:MAG TPA: hypothetical protein PK486_09330, partial [Trichococcus flocculiformis]|nr:hypothetical protein [Trichococcus flocculiformis]
DEATSALDAETEARFWQALHAFVPGMLVLLVTHRVDSLPVLSRPVYEETGKKEVIGKFSKSTASRLLLDIFNKDL